VLSKATEYIKHLEKRNRRLAEEATVMRARLDAFEKLFMSGSMGMGVPPTPNYGPQTYTNSPDFGQSDAQGVDAQGMIQVPEEMRRLHAMSQMNQQLMPVPPAQRPMGRHMMGPQSWTGGYFGKMMVGSLAGLMIMEGFSERSEEGGDTPNARGLFSIPTTYLNQLGQFLRPPQNINIFGSHIAGNDVLTYLKLMLLVGAVVYIFLPSIFDKKPQKKAAAYNSVPTMAPSLASPIHLRRKAWLTATQSIWVPRHNFFLEAAALCLKMLKLSLRSAIGAYGYTLLTGITEEEEAARIKAWEIALDAQLAGGDVEVSKGRLILTLLASGTLPDTPTRLMLKAVHIRVLLWEFGNAGFKAFYMFDELAAKLARWKWNEAKQLQELILHTQKSTHLTDLDALPDHLAALLEQECDDVLVDSIGQRAYNLAWNLPTTHKTVDVHDGMDTVVDDSTIRSPLDAVAAWWSSLVLHRALITSLSSDGMESEMAAAIQGDIDLAVKTAPIGSGAQVRALVARAVLIDHKRGHSIATAVKVLSPLEPLVETDAVVPTLVNTTTATTSIPDTKLSLRCAAIIGQIQRSGSDASKAVQLIVTHLTTPKLSLLGFISAYKLMQALDANEETKAACSRQLEALAGQLRIWMGGPAGGKCGLPKNVRGSIVESCLEINRRVVGMERDEGICVSEGDSDGEGC
jgi:hypothetical protein